MNDFRDVIKLWGSADKMAAALGFGVYAARNWFMRNHIPARYWQRILGAARDLGSEITADDFVKFSHK